MGTETTSFECGKKLTHHSDYVYSLCDCEGSYFFSGAQDKKFWKIEYLYCNVDENMRIMVYPDPEKRNKVNTKSNFVYKRDNLEDLVRERRTILESLNLYKLELSEEEKAELTRFNTQEMYRKVGFKRLYLMFIFGFVSITGYTMYLTNKRKP